MLEYDRIKIIKLTIQQTRNILLYKCLHKCSQHYVYNTIVLFIKITFFITSMKMIE